MKTLSLIAAITLTSITFAAAAAAPPPSRSYKAIAANVTFIDIAGYATLGHFELVKVEFRPME